MADPLFFIALVPNFEIQEEVTAFKNYAAKYFKASRALNSPPHITLQPPFRWNLQQLGTLKQSLLDFSNSQKRFFVLLNNFDCFRPKVIFVKVEPNKELSRLQRELENHLAITIGLKKETQHDFHSHMTVAFKDLQREKFVEAWTHFSKLSYNRVFEPDRICLLQHKGKRWEIINRNLFSFGQGRE